MHTLERAYLSVLLSKFKLMRIICMIVQSKYDGNNYDFAIMKLQVPIPFGKAANAACLPQDPSASYVNENLVVSGWGNMAATGEFDQFPDDLQVTFYLRTYFIHPKFLFT